MSTEQAVKWWELESPPRRHGLRERTESPNTPISAKSKRSIFGLTRQAKSPLSKGSHRGFLLGSHGESDQRPQEITHKASKGKLINPLEELFGGSLVDTPKRSQTGPLDTPKKSQAGPVDTPPKKSQIGAPAPELSGRHRDQSKPPKESQKGSSRDQRRYVPAQATGGRTYGRPIITQRSLDDERELIAQSIMQQGTGGSKNAQMYSQNLRSQSEPQRGDFEFSGADTNADTSDDDCVFGGLQLEDRPDTSAHCCVFCLTDLCEDTLVLKCKHSCHRTCLHNVNAHAIQSSKLDIAPATASQFGFAKCGLCRDEAMPAEPSDFAALLELCAQELRNPVKVPKESNSLASIYDHYNTVNYKSVCASLASSSTVATSASGLQLYFSAVPALARAPLDEAIKYRGDSAHNFQFQPEDAIRTDSVAQSSAATGLSKSEFVENEQQLAAEGTSCTEMDCIIGVRAAESQTYNCTPAEQQHLRQRIGVISTLQLDNRSVYCADYGELRLENTLNCSCDGVRWLAGRVFLFYSGLIICRERNRKLVPIMSLNLDEHLRDVRILKRENSSAIRLGLNDKRSLYLTGDQRSLHSFHALLSDPLLQLPAALDIALKLNIQPPRIRAPATVCICIPTSTTKAHSNHLISAIMVLRSSVLSFCDKLAVVITGIGAPPSLLPLMNARNPNWDARLRAAIHQRMELATSVGGAIGCKDQLNETLWAADEVLAERDLSYAANVILISDNRELIHGDIPAGLLGAGVQISTVAVMPSGTRGVYPLMAVSAASGGQYSRITNLASVGTVVSEIAERACSRTIASVEVSAGCSKNVVVEALLAGDRAPIKSNTIASVQIDSEQRAVQLEACATKKTKSLFDLSTASDEDEANIYLKDSFKFELMPSSSTTTFQPNLPFMPSVKSRTDQSAVVNLGSLAPGESASFVLKLKVTSKSRAVLRLIADYKQSIFSPPEQLCVEVPLTEESELFPESVQRIVIAEVVSVFELLAKHFRSRHVATAVRLIRRTRARLEYITEHCAFDEQYEFGTLVNKLIEQLSYLLDRVQAVLAADQSRDHRKVLVYIEETLWVLRSESIFELEKLKSLCT